MDPELAQRLVEAVESLPGAIGLRMAAMTMILVTALWVYAKSKQD